MLSVPELSSSLRILSFTRSSHCWRIWTASSMEQLSSRMLSIASSLSPSSRVPVLLMSAQHCVSYDEYSHGPFQKALNTMQCSSGLHSRRFQLFVNCTILTSFNFFPVLFGMGATVSHCITPKRLPYAFFNLTRAFSQEG